MQHTPARESAIRIDPAKTPLGADTAAAAVLAHMSGHQGFWIGLVAGAPDALARTRLHLEARAAWHKWSFAGIVAAHPGELLLLISRVGSGALGACPLTWVEIPYDPDAEAAIEWDEAWYDFVLHVELKLTDFEKALNGGLILAAPASLLARLEREAPVLSQRQSLVLHAALRPEGAELGALGNLDASAGAVEGEEGDDAPSPFDRLDSALVAAVRTEPKTLIERIRVGRTRLAEGDIDGAYGPLTAAGEALLSGETPEGQRAGGPGPARMVAGALFQLGKALEPIGEWESAETCYRLAVGLRRMGSPPSSEAKPSRELLLCLNNWADAQWTRGHLDAAIDTYGQALQVSRALYSAQPADVRVVRDLVATGVKLGDARREVQDMPRAEAAYHEAATGLRAVLASPRLDAELLRMAVLLLGRLADAQRANGKLKEALATYRERARAETRLAVIHPHNTHVPPGS